MRSVSISKALIKCPSLAGRNPKEFETETLRAVLQKYYDVMDRMCNEDGWVPTYERLSIVLSPFQDELDKREKKPQPKKRRKSK